MDTTKTPGDQPAVAQKAGAPQIIVNGSVSIDALVSLYNEAAAMKGGAFAHTIVAEAVTSESTAVHNLAMESTSTLLASAVERLARRD
jgi:Fe-S cluster assembly scaffold protein SufB